MGKTKDAKQTILDFLELIHEGKIVLKSYVNDDKYCAPVNARIFSTRPQKNQQSFWKWGCPNKIMIENDPDADGTPEKPFEFFVSCHTHLAEGTGFYK